MTTLIGNLSVDISGRVVILSPGQCVGDKMKYSDDSLVNQAL